VGGSGRRCRQGLGQGRRSRQNLRADEPSAQAVTAVLVNGSALFGDALGCGVEFDRLGVRRAEACAGRDRIIPMRCPDAVGLRGYLVPSPASPGPTG
jgi:hypothetical protein